MSITGRDIHEHMKKAGDYVDWAGTCDSFKAGDPDRAVTGVAVSWMSSTANLREAHGRGCELFITHEPTFYSHMDDEPAFDNDACTLEKRKLLRDTGLTVYRCHDVWDRFPRYGILDSWASFLNMTSEPLAEETFWRVVPIEPQRVSELAREVAARTRQFGQPGVPIIGDPDREVSRVAIGTGAITSAREFYRLGADVGIVTELLWWRDARWALDSDMPVIVVDHTVSEEPGMINLAKYLGEQFPELKVEYIPTHCPYRWISTA